MTMMISSRLFSVFNDSDRSRTGLISRTMSDFDVSLRSHISSSDAYAVCEFYHLNFISCTFFSTPLSNYANIYIYIYIYIYRRQRTKNLTEKKKTEMKIRKLYNQNQKSSKTFLLIRDLYLNYTTLIEFDTKIFFSFVVQRIDLLV